MFNLNRKLTSSTTVAERSVGEKTPQNSISPRPTCPRNSFHPFQRPLPAPVTASPSSNFLSPNLLSKTNPTPCSHQSFNSTSRIIRARKPHTGRSIIDNDLRPHVPAADRIFSWRTPFGSRHQRDVASRLPPPLLESAMMAVRGALAPNTKSTYAAGPLRFTQFCDKWAISEEARMPADYALLCAFIGEHKGLYSGNTIRSWMSGLRSWHIMNHAPWYGDDAWVHLARTSANKEGTKHKHSPRAPVSIEHLSCLRRSIHLSNPYHAAIWAVALVTFFGCRRLGETTLTVASAFDPKYHVLRSTKYVSLFTTISYWLYFLPFFRISFRALRDGTRSASFDIPWTKSTKELGATVIITARRHGDPLCPVAAFKNHLDINSSIPASSTLFAYTSSSGEPINLLKHNFLSFVTNIWSSAMLAHILGHSFRIGGAVELLLAGVPPEIVAATGGWTSLAFLLYWRRMDEILPMSTSKAYNQADLDRLTSIFEHFCIAHKIPTSLLDNSSI
jgi:hypothetical protein